MNKPTIFTEGTYTLQDLEEFRNGIPVRRLINNLPSQIEELAEIEQTKGQDRPADERLSGDWIYFPWSEQLIHNVNQAEYFRLRTNRNQLLITTHEQSQLTKTAVGFAGLSIGSHFVASLAHSGIAQNMKLADMDSLSTTNLNRVNAGMAEIGLAKIDVITQKVYEVNPYQKFQLYPQGLDESNIDQFMTKSPKLDLVFEAVDDFKLKVQLRQKAREYRIPVVMITNLGDSILIDIERYDLDPQPKLFNGWLDEASINQILFSPMQPSDILEIILKLIGEEHLPTAIIQSLNNIGSTLVGRPQLFSTVAIGGGIAAYVARQILLHKPNFSGRKKLDLTSVFAIDQLRDKDGEERERLIGQLRLKARS